MKYIKYLVVSLVVLLSFSIAAFAEEAGPKVKSEVKSAMTPTAEVAQHEHAMGKEKRVVATVDADGVQRVEVIGGEYYFDPNYIVVKVNKPVELTVRKAPGYIPHDMVVKAPEAGIDFKVDLDAKKTDIVKFTPTKIGKYEMFCDKKMLFFKSHKDKGMDGMIEVVE
ncbi:MAG: cupredoxin domain-containing protein [Nitrospirae bacterium]|nr:cupredoxin domain-containing protein [Nitrospirota bacterium]